MGAARDGCSVPYLSTNTFSSGTTSAFGIPFSSILSYRFRWTNQQMSSFPALDFMKYFRSNGHSTMFHCSTGITFSIVPFQIGIKSWALIPIDFAWAGISPFSVIPHSGISYLPSLASDILTIFFHPVSLAAASHCGLSKSSFVLSMQIPFPFSMIRISSLKL